MSAHKKGEYWLLADAKNRFSEVARCSLLEGPQKIFRREGNVVVISEQEYLKLKGENKDFKEFLLNSTPNMAELELTRDKSSMRDISL